HQVLEAHIADLDRRMAEMELSREMTLHALECRAHDVATCPHFRRNVEDLIAGTATFALPAPAAHRLRDVQPHDRSHSDHRHDQRHDQRHEPGEGGR
ncbi:MAG: hypothetical protein WB767_17455, partial [Nocardioides sp.]